MHGENSDNRRWKIGRNSSFCAKIMVQLEKQSETADLRQRHVIRQVAAPYSVWQRFPLCPTESNVNENFKVVQNPGFLLDHPSEIE